MIEIENVGVVFTRKSAIRTPSFCFTFRDKLSNFNLQSFHIPNVLLSVFWVPNIFHIFGVVCFPFVWIFEWHTAPILAS